MNEDYKRVEEELRLLTSTWEQHKVSLLVGVESEDVETVVNSFLHIYEIFYSVKYNLWKAQMIKKDYKLGQRDLALLITELIPTLEHLKKDLEKSWLNGSVKIKRVLDKKAERELYAYLNQNFGSGKYAVDLG
jgi:hypothetical protein